MTTRTRFAPSPTGSLHVGGARTALYCLLHARHQGGRFVLRIEDTDRARSTEAAARGILDDLRWLDLGWDEGPEVGGDSGPYFQSARLEIYNRYLDQLLASGHAYQAWESREELGALRDAAMAAKQNFRYRQRQWTDAELAGFKAEGRVPVLRLRASGQDLTVDDRILGPVTVAAEDLEDFIIRKADGFPTYHFAVVVDDHLMGITQVLRGQEHLMNTHKHLAIYQALGWEPPAYGHMPLIFNPAGQKMSKREKARAARAAARVEAKARGVSGWEWLAELTGHDLDTLQRFMKKKHDSVALAGAIAQALSLELPMIEVMDFRRGGYLPEALINYLALLGWSPGDDREVLDRDELIALFTLERVNNTAARFDPTKLAWMNGHYMKRLPSARLLEVWSQYHAVVPDSPTASLSDPQRVALLSMYVQRADTFADLDRMAAFFTQRPSAYEPKAVKKHLLKADGAGLLQLAAARQALATAEWTPAGLEACLSGLAELRGVRLGALAQPLRVAISGAAATPGLYETLGFFSKEEVLARVDACMAHFT